MSGNDERFAVGDNRDLGTIIPSVLDDYGLNPNEFRVYARLARRTGAHGQCWESVHNIAVACKMGDRTVQYCLRILEKARLVTRRDRPKKTTLYSLNPASQWVSEKELDAIRKQVRNEGASKAPLKNSKNSGNQGCASGTFKGASDAPKGIPLKGLKIEQGTRTLTGCSRPEPGRERESAPFDEPFSWEEGTAANVTIGEGQPTAAYSKPVSVQPESNSPLETQESKGRGKSFAANSTTVKNSGTVAPLQSVRIPKRSEQQPVKFTINDAGWLQMPKAKAYGFARWLTVRRLNYQMACAFSNIKPAKDEQGRNIVQGNQLAFRWGDRLILEDDLLGDDGELGFAELRDELFEKDMLTQSAFNDLLERLFMDSLVWTRANGEDGSKRLKTASPAFVFFNGDSKLFQAARQGANKMRV